MTAAHLMKTYSPQPVAFARGEGAWLWDTGGRRYLDALAGIAVNGLGHAHPALTKAIAEQAAKLIHTSNLFVVPEQERAAEKVCALAGMDNAFFCNSSRLSPRIFTPSWARMPVASMRMRFSMG